MEEINNENNNTVSSEFTIDLNDEDTINSLLQQCFENDWCPKIYFEGLEQYVTTECTCGKCS
tara:strand:+ start:1293 stop:1478 length:186 start_codon:yes stop_codon:yes gene_type:complete